ncbi:hypothetical protein CWI39_0101p0030 [Hamiltosporidium magnivora]|uniref:Integrase zinc-binding domain-containing protein n=1 Tax=Hamiltosporidium magnivora TaxID=148818 RepID=A0A4Q9LP80_9MICR|nr:hypothetical protein CWI39_0101p0030 [Hamiltosporidium magnivora]
MLSYYFQEKEILTAYLKTGQYPTANSKEEKRLLRQKSKHFTLLGDDICFRRRDHLIRAVFGFKTALIKQIIQTKHAVADIGVNKMMALIAQKYYGIPKEYIKEHVKECEACTNIYKSYYQKYDLFMVDYVDLMGYADQNDHYSWILDDIDTYTKHLWSEHINNVVCAYNRRIHGVTNKSPFMLFFGQPGFNNPLSRSILVKNEPSTIVPAIDIDPDIDLEIASDVHEEFTETVTTTTTVIAYDLEIDSKIRSDVAKHFKNYRERIIESNKLK